MSETHPKALEAAEKTKERADLNRSFKQLLAEMTAEGVRFVEVQPEYDFDDGLAKKAKRGRMTIAYIPLGRNVLAVATAICHPSDEFNKTYGRVTAGVRLTRGECIELRKPSNALTVKQWLTHKFTEYAG
jgi:hypothetical protein